ncbi:uncharacterized protein Dana_GF14776 [Drosophila ananassae]|uniref:SNRNP25 ubiquitin-like domain-containing protein n=1 Tax=Drosophila ananassae TaxID=7217 RepID=B3MMT7_DROAN|nr:uncharacterized protein LOC6497595 [Drosophila ananassae]EDV30962.2 uncharacterized protein Dana_GF14776 [Drosophila ananassae]
MDRHRRESSPYRERRRTSRSSALTYKKLQAMPTNLRKKAVRQARNNNEKILGKRKNSGRRRSVPSARRVRNDFDQSEHNAMLASTSRELRHILENFSTLSDIPHDITSTELLGEIAIAEGQATTIHVQRDGLSTLTVVLHQPEPTIAHLKRAIANISLAQHRRKHRERHEERLRRRGITEDAKHEEHVSTSSTGELVHSARRNGHDHRAFVSWRFLWRCFCLFNVDKSQPIDDRGSKGRTTLRELGIENATTLKFAHRVKYFGRQRQS